MTDPAFLAAFRDTSLPPSAFHHRDHVRMAWLYLRECGPIDATPRFVADLQRFATAKGVPGLYHATITAAYMTIIAERMTATPVDTWDAFADAHPDLLTWKPGVLDRYYTDARLTSPLARAQFLMPDRLASAD